MGRPAQGFFHSSYLSSDLGKRDLLWRFPRLRTLKPTLTPPVTHDPSSGNDYVEHHKGNSSASPLSHPPPYSPTEANGSSLTHSPHPHPPPNPSSTSTNKIPPSHSPGDQLCRFPYGEVSQDPSHPILASIPLHPTPPRYQPPDIILPTSITPHSLPYSPPPTSQFSPLQATNSLGLQGPRNDNSWNI